MLVGAFLKTFSEENNRPVAELTSDAMQAIIRYDWPGNVRELRTAIEHGVVMATGPKITLRDLPLPVRQNSSQTVSQPRAVVTQEKRLDLHTHEHHLIQQALVETDGNVTLAAQRLGISRRTLHRRLKELKQAPADEHRQ